MTENINWETLLLENRGLHNVPEDEMDTLLATADELGLDVRVIGGSSLPDESFEYDVTIRGIAEETTLDQIICQK